MALETLKGVEKIGGFEVAHDPIGSTGNYDPHIGIFHEANAIVFKIQDGPVKENGVNGCQVDTLIHAAKLILERLNEKLPDWRNDDAISSLNDALYRLKQRTKDRESRGVEGASQA